TALLLLLAAAAERRLPAPRRASPDADAFDGYRAHAHLVNLTAIGARVAGSYENEVLAVRWAVQALRQVAAHASPHNSLEIDVHSASGAFPLTFLDGMNNVYRDVQSVVARARGRGGETSSARRTARPTRTALLINCHYDTVPGSPGASDDGAGCAVALEALRALLAAPRPLRHDLVLLLNGAEENILQASHAFITTHKWARDVRAFVNIEACGAGGREVLFQAGPHDPWMLEVYAGAVPHPFASSLAQELFQSGLIPADTDFRIFRDFGGLSGMDLAWSSNGYVYHTWLDTAARVPLAALQRTGDNVLALLQGLLARPELEREPERGAAAPVFFDVLGVAAVAVRAPAALLAAAGALALLLLRLHLTAAHARAQLYMKRGEWARVVCGAGAAVGAGLAGGLGASAAVGALLHALGARLAFYSRPWLLVPLYALPAVCGCWATARWTWARAVGARGAAVRGWWRARACGEAVCLWGGVALAACAARGLRSGFVPFLWVRVGAGRGWARARRGGVALTGGWAQVACGAAADVGASAVRAADGRRAVLWALGAALPAAHTAYLALASLNMFVPIMGRAGTPPVPTDVLMALLVALLTLSTLSWALPLAVAAPDLNKLVPNAHSLCQKETNERSIEQERRGARRACDAWGAACVVAASAALAASGGARAAYSGERPQRVLLFHTRRTDHARAPPSVDNFFWIPEIDANTPHSLVGYVEGVESARAGGAAGGAAGEEECSRWVYCGAPYYLPVRRLIARGHSLPARSSPRTRLQVAAHRRRLNDTTAALHLHIRGPQHVVVVVAPAEGALLRWSSVLARPLEGPRWGRRRTYFLSVHHARAPANMHLELHIQHEEVEGEVEGEAGGQVAQLSVAGHSMFGEDALSEEHQQLLERLPPWTAPFGWGVDLHLFAL
ncbi:endoplasmic reticulum metallopeptidase 1, partial [Papilio machaon]|uniref:endoplasmic reticulum metallopeptidase 1 n=1 Tax=Papilio machaon TaxID=76193 RepID=UPI001E6630B0